MEIKNSSSQAIYHVVGEQSYCIPAGGTLVLPDPEPVEPEPQPEPTTDSTEPQSVEDKPIRKRGGKS